MIPVKIDESEYDYSNFQPDQILTADNLNHIFDFLYLQERLTRTNLIGIGIVCGLAVSRSADGKSVTITKGTAVTSHGYLMAHGIENSNDPVVYKKYRNFDAKKEEFYYDVFINKSDNSQKYALWELVAKEDEINTDSELSAGFLDSKVCLLFYEVLDEKAKNCDPTSCDDKGVKVYVNVRKLLVSILDADKIIAECNAKANASGSGELFPDLFTLPEIKLPKFDVPATTLETANDVYEAYQQVFTKKFVESTGETLKLAYTAFKPMLQTSTSVFDTFNTKFAFLHNGSISGNSLLHFQYYYELFADLALAYKEWRDAAYSLAGMCTPPEALFPRHVFLGTFTGMSDIVKSKYRNYFVPSPILQSCRSSYQEFQSLFQRIVRIIVNVDIPTPVVSGGKPVDNNIRITPSVLGKYTLGDRAIPYYYKVDGSQSLLSTWNYLLTARGKEKQNLHYNPSYSSDDFVKNPLEYDIEPYNFFRIEGHIGKKFDSALASIQTLRNNFRLPFDIVALTVDTLVGKINPADFPCHFVELEAQYDILRTELMCTLCKSVTCLYLQPLKYVAGNPPIDKLLPSKLDLIPGCKSKLQYGELTVGVVYEEIYPELKKGTQDITGLVKKAIGTSKPSDDVSIIVIIIRLIHANVLLADVVPANLSSYTSGKVLKALDDQKNILKQISDVKDGILYERFKNKECIRDLYDLCDLGAFTTLYKEYQTRIEKLKQLQSLKEFSKLHPGIQHKGGVPSGGTFILVYRDLETDTTPDPGIPLPSLLADQPVLSLATTTTTVAAVSAAEKKVTAGKKLTVKEKAVAQQRINLMTAKGMKKDEIESILGLGVFELAKVKGIFEDALENVAQGVVIADFYLPYLCCSDCPPVQFVVNIPPPKITFSLNKYDYCGEDQEKYYFLTSPSGGKITTVDAQKDTFVDNGDGTFTFLPAKAVIAPDQAKVSISYTYMAEGLAQTITVTVYRKPAVKIMVTPDPNNPRKFTFAFDSPAMITGVTWNFGDNSPVSHDIAPPAYTYKSGGEFTVSAEVTNGVCSAKPESVIVKAGDPEPVKVTIGTDQICQDVDKLEFSITPPGGTLSGEKFEESPQGSGKYIFHPSNVDMQGKSQRTITFNYVSLQNETASFTITVYAKPAGTSNVDQGGLLRAVAAFNQLKNASQVVVYFGDNTKEEIYPVANLTSFVTPAHLYAKGDTYTIKMRLENGTCVTVLEERKITVVGRTLLEMKCRPLEDPMPGFEALQPDIKKNKAAFKGYPLEDVGKFIELLSGALDVSGNVELKFFDKDPRMIPDWITLLPLTETSTSVSVRMLAGFNNVLLYRACQRKEDVDDVLLALFEALQEKLKAITILNDDDKLVLNAILNNLQKELENLAQNGEDQIKLVYVRILKALIKLVKTLLK